MASSSYHYNNINKGDSDQKLLFYFSIISFPLYIKFIIYKRKRGKFNKNFLSLYIYIININIKREIDKKKNDKFKEKFREEIKKGGGGRKKSAAENRV